MRRDHKVEFRTRETIGAWAGKVRRLAGIQNQLSIDICAFIETKLARILEPMGKGKLQIEMHEQGTLNPGPAHVSFSPPTLHVEKHIWNKARNKDPFACFVLAHEVGHLLLHDHFAKSFSEDPSLRVRFAEKEYSAEWQADTFAGDLLLPASIAARFPDEDFLIEECHIYERVVKEKLSEIKARHYQGDACKRCSNFTLFRQASTVVCDTCGDARSEE